MRRVLICLYGGLLLTGCEVFQGAPAASLSYEKSGIKVECNRGAKSGPGTVTKLTTGTAADFLRFLRILPKSDTPKNDASGEDNSPRNEDQVQKVVEACLRLTESDKQTSS